MRHSHPSARLAYGLCLAALPAGLLAHLALTDILHGEADVTVEWRVLPGAGVLIAAAVISALRVLRRVVHADGAERSGGGTV